MKFKLVAAAACGLMLLCRSVQAAEVKVLASGAVKEAALELFPQFEKVSGNKVAVTWAGTVESRRKSRPARSSISSSSPAPSSMPSSRTASSSPAARSIW